MTIQRNNLAQKVLSPAQLACKPLLEIFSSTHILAGGTAIALQLWHRQSIDFDFFCFGHQWTGRELSERIQQSLPWLQQSWLHFDPEKSSLNRLSDDEQSEVILFTDTGVRIQLIDFSRNPFDIALDIPSNITLCEWIPSYNLETLWAFKLYAMMYRTKRKDAVDLRYILHQGYTLDQLIAKTENLFGKLYQSIASIENIVWWVWDESEEVVYLDPQHPTNEDILHFLKQEAKKVIEK